MPRKHQVKNTISAKPADVGEYGGGGGIAREVRALRLEVVSLRKFLEEQIAKGEDDAMKFIEWKRQVDKYSDEVDASLDQLRKLEESF